MAQMIDLKQQRSINLEVEAGWKLASKFSFLEEQNATKLYDVVTLIAIQKSTSGYRLLWLHFIVQYVHLCELIAHFPYLG